jgi:hypothetical protein
VAPSFISVIRIPLMINIGMRITELTGYKQSPEYQSLTKNPSFQEFVRLAKEKGWTFYGQGGNGAVLKHPGRNWVYKVFSEHAAKESGYYGYVTWAAQHQHNPFVPRVGKPIKIPRTAHRPMFNLPQMPDQDLHIVRLELLEPAKGGNDPRFEKYIDPKYNRSQTSNKHLDLGEELTLYDHAIASLWRYNKDYREVWDFAHHQWDMGINNIMFRDNQLVITDPMA